MGKFKEIEITKKLENTSEIDRTPCEGFTLKDFWRLVMTHRHPTVAGLAGTQLVIEEFISNYVDKSKAS